MISPHLSARRVAVLAVLATIATAPGADAAVTAQLQAGTVTVTGDDAGDTVTVLGTPAELQVDVGADGTADFSFPRAAVDAVTVRAGGGDDTIQTGGGALVDDAVTYDGQGGADTLRGGPGAQTLIGGSGGDRFLWGPGDGSDVVEGQTGRDVLEMRGAEIGEAIAVEPDGSRTRITRDIAGVVLDTAAVEQLGFAFRGGADTIDVGALAGTAVTRVVADLTGVAGGPDGARDTVVVNGTAGDDRPVVSAVPGGTQVSAAGRRVVVTGGDAGLDTIAVDSGAGADAARYLGTTADDVIAVSTTGSVVSVETVPAGPRVELAGVERTAVLAGAGADSVTASGQLAGLTIDGGADDDVLRGGAGADVIKGGAGRDVLDGNQGDDGLQLGAGDDTAEWGPGEGSDRIDGSTGFDTLAYTGSGIGETVGIGAAGTRVRVTRDIAGGTVQDTGALEQIVLAAGGGEDRLRVGNLAGTAVVAVAADLGADGVRDTLDVAGTSGRDVVAVTRDGGQAVVAGFAAITRVGGTDPGTDVLGVQTLDGDDYVTVAGDLRDLVEVAVDLGAGED